ncbi:Gfo/Idh/MocA family oxidoreductase [Clostridium sp. LY3-2]|uniref:Gfo/Idh/MocA family protein n=1 Tax=Clostridium sp. LY3-2 TaxID=2942482 RepID=UPI002152C29C|nr:Gfo/Idh/MocA family oxidoreductase [Clostridium sp. LY3-2]MCR6514597.1 Gfo/Idh/MocA family oxidoreductase [Clostridium sp. LY3-2]
MKNLKWGILGPGTIAKDFAKALNKVNGNVYAVGSRNLEKANNFKDEFGVTKAFGNYDELLDDKDLDVIYVSTPHSNHYEYIKKALLKGKHVLCEKAITVNSNELKEVKDIAKEKGLVLEEAMTIYHMPIYKELKEKLAKGELGELKMINVTFGSCKEDDPSNRFFNKDLAGGALLDIGTYALSFVRSFLSKNPCEILTTVKKYQTGVDEQSGIILKNKNDEMAVVTLTMRAKMPKRGIVACTNGFITVDDFPRANKAIITYLDGRVEEVIAGDSNKALEYEIAYMNDAILNNKRENTLELSTDVMDIMDSLRESFGIKYPFER